MVLSQQKRLILARASQADIEKGMCPGGLLGQWLLSHTPWKPYVPGTAPHCV